MQRRIICLLALASLAWVAAVPTGARAAVPPKLVGCWDRHVTEADWTRAGEAGYPVGTWAMKIRADGSVWMYAPGEHCGGSADFTTTVTVKQARLTFAPVPVCASSGAYSWKLLARGLALAAIADRRCHPRIGLYTGTWSRV